MLYSEIKRETLGHINQYSMAGAQVAPSYNNQADYLTRIPQLINEALVNIVTLVKRSPEVVELKDGEEYGGFMRYELPGNFYSMKSGGVSVIKNGKLYQTNQYWFQGKKHILTPKDAGLYVVEYYRYPNQLPLHPNDNTELEEDLEVIQAATYYAAANLVMQEDEFAYASLYNDYESRLSRISPGITLEVHPVQDAYGFNVGCC